MFKNLLVPLDGSTLSEASLDAAAVLAKRLGAPVTLLHVIEQDAPEHVHDERHLTEPEEAKAYLGDAAKRAFPPAVKVQTHVHTAPVSDVAKSIVEHAASEFEPDLIITCTHGRGGMSDLLFGSIAQQVVAQGTTPLLLIKPGGPPFDLGRILLPLDADSIHDESIEPGKLLAKAFAAELILLSVIPTYGTLRGDEAATSSLMPGATQAVLDLREENAGEHLTQHAQDLRRAGIQARAIVARGDPAGTIVRTAEQESAGLIILSTHRRSGMGAFWARSVAPKVARLAKTPLLLIPLADEP